MVFFIITAVRISNPTSNIFEPKKENMEQLRRHVQSVVTEMKQITMGWICRLDGWLLDSGSFNYVVGSSDYIGSNDRMISE
jgi:hypothetical protein